jgi:pimeloyl-ACP methyl ester carboxylesterase
MNGAGRLGVAGSEPGRPARLARRIAVLAGLWMLSACPIPAAAAAVPRHLELGTQRLSLCSSAPVTYCGWFTVPLGYRSPAGPRIRLHYTWYPATEVRAAEAKGTVVPVEGGPGYGSTGSVEYSSGGMQVGYRAMYGALLGRRNLLALDNRGTGRSDPLNCPNLQGFSGPTGTAAFQQAVAACGESLNHRWRYPDGSWVHASDLFSSAPAAADLAGLIRALGLGRVDLYGDSYGSFFAQVFASRYPEMLRSLTLDSTYRTVGLDPWYRSSIESMGADFDAACARSAACAAAAPGSSWARIGTLAANLREKPISGRVPGPSGRRETVSMGVVGLVDLVSDAAEDTAIYRGLDAAARAYLDEGDARPLLRLYAQRLAADEAYFGEPVSEYSVALYFADSCLDYPQLFSLGSSPAGREAELLSAEQSVGETAFAPFTVAEWLSMDENTEALTGCLGWPKPSIAEPPIDGGLPLGASLPVLVLGGELDTWTPPVDAPKVLAEIGGDTRFVELANSTHVVGEGDTVCGSTIVQEFVADPGSVQTLDTSCAASVPAIHTVGVYPAELSGEPALSPAPGIEAGAEALRLAAAAVSTAGDAVARAAALEVKRDVGLDGGTVTASRGASRLTLANDQLIGGVRVSGTVSLSPAPDPEDGELAIAELSATAPGLRRSSLHASWTTSGTGALARVTGTVEGAAVDGTMPAP